MYAAWIPSIPPFAQIAKDGPPEKPFAQRVSVNAIETRGACGVAIIPLGLRSLESSMRPTRGCDLAKRSRDSQGNSPSNKKRSQDLRPFKSLSRFFRPSSRASSSLLFGLAPRGVCRAPDIAIRTVGSYPTFSPLPVRHPNWPARGFASCRPPRRIPHPAVYFLWHFP